MQKLLMLQAFLTTCIASEERTNCYLGGIGGVDIVFDSIGENDDVLFISYGDEGYIYEMCRTDPETGEETIIAKGELDSVSQLKKLVKAEDW